VVRTYAPCGQTPVLRVFQTRDHLLVLSGITPAGQLFTLTRSDSLTTVESVHFLKHLRSQLGTDVLAVWDGSPIHRGPVLRSFLAGGGAPSVSLEQLPGYAPDLNPDEGVWDLLKYDEMRNLCCRDFDHLGHELRLAILRLRRTPHRIQDCFEAAGLAL
jgi:transposase